MGSVLVSLLSVSGTLRSTLYTLVYLGGLLAEENGCALYGWVGLPRTGRGLPPVLVVRRPMKLVTIAALNCVTLVLVSVSPLPGVVRGSVAPLKVLQETLRIRSTVSLPVFTFGKTNTCANMIQILCNKCAVFF